MTSALLGLVLASTWTLSVRRDEPATTCPDENRLRRSIAERLGKDPFLDAPPAAPAMSPDDELGNPFAPGPKPASAPTHRTLVVVFSRTALGHVAQVSLVGLDGKETGRRELSSTASDCGELAGAVVLAAAIVIDPMVMTRAEPVRAQDAGVTDEWAAPPLSRPPDAPRPPPVTSRPLPPPTTLPPLATAPPSLMLQPPITPRSTPVTKKPEPPALHAIFVGLGGGVSLGQVPGVAGLGQVHGSWGTRNTLLTARFGATTPGGVTVGSGGVRVLLLDGGVEGCAKWLVFGVCLSGDVGSVQAWSVGLPNPRPQSALFFGLGAGGLLDIRAGALVRVRLHATGLVQPRVIVAVGGVPVWQSSQFAFTAALSLHFKVWGDVLP
ncbi:MAG: hypothetical protein Q8S33_12845 [Myxococcales bacterium]|nr:hypothetical protein [Myxococcales bacterium]